MLNKNGSSSRANAQVNRLNKNIPDKYKAIIIAKGIAGRRAALELERALVTDYFILNRERPQCNSRPKPDRKSHQKVLRR